MDKQLIERASIPVEERCPMDEFENAIRKVGIVAACEWFGHKADSEFTAETIDILAMTAQERLAEIGRQGKD